MNVRLMAALAGVLALTGVATAQAAPSPEGVVASFDVRAEAQPLRVEVLVPNLVPLQINGGAARSEARVNSQPRVTAEASPIWFPLAADSAALGGPGAMPGLVVSMLPGFVVGAPTIFGFAPLPLDASVLPRPETPMFPFPPPPDMGCRASSPGGEEKAECADAAQEVLGFDVGANAGRAAATGGEGARGGALSSSASAEASAVRPAAGNTSVPLLIDNLSSAATAAGDRTGAVAAAQVRAQNLQLGPLRIESMASAMKAAAGGVPGSASATAPGCAVSGASLDGRPVIIDNRGVWTADGPERERIGDDDGILPPEAASAVLANLDELLGEGDPGTLKLRALPAPVISVEPGGDGARASGGCLELTYAIAASGTKVRVVLGAVSVFAQARPQPDFGMGMIGAPAPPMDGGGLVAAPPSTPGSPVSAPPAVSAPITSAPVVARFLPPLPLGDWRPVFYALTVMVALMPVLAFAPWVSARRRRQGRLVASP